MDNSAIMCDEIIDSHAKLSPKDDEKETNCNKKKKKKQLVKRKISILYLHFY